jgi:hypothetical protein
MDSDKAAPRVPWAELVAMTPEVIRESLPVVPWSLRKLWALELPARHVAVADLGRLVVLDGFHRLLKAATEGRAEVDAIVLSQADLELICGS